MSIRPLDEQKCSLDIHMSIRPLDEQKCPLDIQMSIRPMDEQKDPVDIQMSIGHLGEVLDMYVMFQTIHEKRNAYNRVLSYQLTTRNAFRSFEHSFKSGT